MEWKEIELQNLYRELCGVEAKGWKALVRFLSLRDHSEHEVSHYLLERSGCEEKTAGAFLRALRDSGLVDDARFARERTRYRCESGYGPLYIRQDLEAAGISSGLIESVLHTIDEAAFLEWGGRYLARNRTGGSRDEKRLADRMLRRGYPSDLIRRMGLDCHEE